MLRVDSVKFFADGGLTSATAAISTPYRETGTTGVMIWEDEDLADSMWEAHSAGLRIGTHANGDVAIEQVLKIYELLAQRRPGTAPPDRAPGPAHARAARARLRAIGAMAATQTVFCPRWARPSGAICPSTSTRVPMVCAA